jgi:hypothetical protein
LSLELSVYNFYCVDYVFGWVGEDTLFEILFDDEDDEED